MECWRHGAAVCLLFDRRGERLIRELWSRLEEEGTPTLQTHTHGRHHPHLSYAVLLAWDLDDVRRARSRTFPTVDPSRLPSMGPWPFRGAGPPWCRRAVPT